MHEDTEADRNRLFKEWLAEHGLGGEDRPKRIKQLWETYTAEMKLVAGQLEDQWGAAVAGDQDAVAVMGIAVKRVADDMSRVIRIGFVFDPPFDPYDRMILGLE